MLRDYIVLVCMYIDGWLVSNFAVMHANNTFDIYKFGVKSCYSRHRGAGWLLADPTNSFPYLVFLNFGYISDTKNYIYYFPITVYFTEHLKPFQWPISIFRAGTWSRMALM